MLNIFNSFKTYANLFFNTGHERSILAKKNIIEIILLKGLGVMISFIIVPMTISYINADTYGIWLTLSSTIAWISLFDAGINNGLRNKLSEALANNDFLSARGYISTTYIILSWIFLPLFFIFISISNFVNWAEIFGWETIIAEDLNKVIIIVFGYFCIRFILSTTNVVFLANQSPAYASFWSLLEQVASVGCIYLLTLFSEGSLLNLSFGLCLTPIFVLMLSNIYSYNVKFRHLKPSVKYYNKTYSKSILSIGLKFFIIQIAGIIQFQTANFIIINSFGPTDVTIYNIVFKYFSIVTFGMSIILTPLWSAVTNAYYLGDDDWIINCVSKYQKLGFVVIGFGFLLLIFSNFAYVFWLGNNSLQIPIHLSFWMFLFTATTTLGSIYVGVLNGIGALKIQFLSAMISPFIFVLSCYFLIQNFNAGVSSIIIASILGNYNGIILAPLQYYKVFIQRSTNPIWKAR